jgi:hypothetical protein
MGVMTYSVYTCTGGKFNIDDWDKGKCFKLPEDDTKPNPDPSPGPGPNPNARYIYNSDPSSQSAYKNTGLLSREELLALYNNYKPVNSLAMLGNLDTVEYAKIQSDASSKSCKAKDISFLFGENEYSKDELSETHEDVQTLCTTYENSNSFSTGEVGCESATIGAYGGMRHEGLILQDMKDKNVCNWESEGKCFPITYDPINKKDDKGNPQYFYNPMYATKYTKTGDKVDTTAICAELKNRTMCDNEKRYNIVDSVKNICKWTTGIGAFVDPEINFTGAANICDEGPAYKTQVGICKVNRGLETAMGGNNVGDGSYTSNDTGYSQVQCAGLTRIDGVANYALVTRAQCNNSELLNADGNTRSCFFEPTMGSYELRNGYRLERRGEFDIAKASPDGAANRRCTQDNDDKPCMQNKEDFVNCGTCVKNPALGVSVSQGAIKQTTRASNSDYSNPMSVNRTYTDANGEPYKSMSADTNGLFINDLNKGDNNEPIKLKVLNAFSEVIPPANSTLQNENNWIFDYEVYTIQNPTKPSEMLKICVRKVGDLPETSPISNWSNEPQMPSVISNYLGNKEIGPNASPKLGLQSIERKNTGWWAATLEYKESSNGNDYAVMLTVNGTDHPDNRYDMKTYKKHLKKFNNYNLEIRIHPDYEDTYKFAIGTKDNKPKTGTRVFNRWYFNRLLQLPIHESQIDNTTGGPKANHGLPTLESFFKFNSTNPENYNSILTYPNDAMDYLYFYTADSSKTDQPQDDLEFKFKANWAEIVTEIYEEPECGRYNESRFTCTAQTQPGFRSGNAPTCLYTPKVHCKGEWRDPPTVVDVDGNNVANTCGLVQPGVKIKQYVELSAGKLDAINDVWNPGNYESIIGAQCDEEDIGWLVYTDTDASASGTIATDTFRMKTLEDGSDNPKYDSSRELPKGITGTPQTGTWKRAIPKHGDLKYVACDEDCAEETFLTTCETPGDLPSISPNYSGTFDERKRMNFVVPEDTPDDTPMEELANSYDFSNAWYASENNCSGNFTEYKQIKVAANDTRMIAQGKYGKACPNFTDEESRGNFGSFESFDAYGNFTRGGACTIPKQTCIAGSSCIVNTDKITNLVDRINKKPNVRNEVVQVDNNNNQTLPDDDSMSLTIDGVKYNHDNKITKEILFRLAKKECDRFGDLYGFPNKSFCTEDKEIYISETDPTVPPCEYKAGSCYVDQYTTTYTSSPGLRVEYRKIIDVSTSLTKNEKYRNALPMYIRPYEFCKWIDMPDLPSE